ncbi:hypothetical protein MMC13_000746 [Lambiella insularis]|nr:hypothetical protein [Lambiella insularis]
MRFSVLPVLALASTFSGVFSAPTPEAADVSLGRRQATKSSIVTSLIDTIVPTLNSMMTAAQAANASDTVPAALPGLTTQLNTVVAAITSSTAAAQGLSAAPLKHTHAITVRQATVPLGVLLGELIADVLAAVDALLASLGLGPASGLLAPLGPALSGLLLALEVVVDDLLAAVETLVNDLLTGLAAGLIIA